MNGGDGAEGGVDAIWLAHQPYLVDLAFRMLGRIQDAEDAVQEAFSRLLGADIGRIEDIRGWLVVVVSRLCLDQLRSARHRRETTVGSVDDARVRPAVPLAADPADRVTLDDTVRLALLVVLEELSPSERAVFVLHDVFRYSFDAIAAIVGRTPAACRQLASRARRRIESETGPGRFRPDAGEHHLVASEFIAACAGGDLDRLLSLLDPDVVGDVDLGPVAAARRPLRGSRAVSRNLLVFFGPDTATTLVSQPINRHAGILAFRGGQLAAVLVLKVRDERVHDIHAIGDPAKLAIVGRQLSLAG
jgi:RNA polymerase sigma-70 factor, ECF subfamily